MVSVANELYFDVFVNRENKRILVGTKVRPGKALAIDGTSQRDNHMLMWPLRIFNNVGIFGGMYYTDCQQRIGTNMRQPQYLGAIH